MVALSASRLVCEAISWMSLIDVADLLRCVGQALHGDVGAVGLVDRLAGDLGRIGDLTADLLNRGRELFRRAGDRLDVRRGLLRGGGHRGRLGTRLLGVARKRVGGVLHLARRARDRAKRGLRLAVEHLDRPVHLVLALLPFGEHRLLVDRDGKIHVEHHRRIHGRLHRGQLGRLAAISFDRQFLEHAQNEIVAADIPTRLQSDLVVNEADRAHAVNIGFVETPVEQPRPM